MMRYSNVYVVILLVISGTAAASTPSVDQLLDRFAANADSHSGSFKIKLESSREIIIRKTDSTFFKPGKAQEHHSLDCRWDGQRMRLRKRSRAASGITKINPEERISYESRLYDLSEQVLYRKDDDQPEKQTVTYYDRNLIIEACFNEVIVNVGNWVWGYFHDEDATRIDGFLRWSPTARVRPKTELIDNSECYVLEADTRSAKYTIWFDPAHGYNFARLHYEKPGTKIVVSNRLFRKYEEAWIPMEMEWEVQLIHLNSEMSYSQKTVVTEFEVNPNHEMLRSFVLDDIPEGTKATFVSRKGHQIPGDFEWRNGKPVPCVDEETLARLNSVAESIGDHATSVSSTDTNKYSLDVASVNRASPAPHCGLHCLYLMMKVYGQDPNLGELVTPEYLDTPDGSTLSGLKKAVEDAGLHAEIVLRANTRVLRACPGPVILHVKGSEASRDYDHYILFLGTEGSWARICDPPGSVRLISFDELSSRWDGRGLVVTNTPIQLAGLLRQAKMRLFLMAGLVVLAMLLIGRVKRHIVWPEILSSVAGRSAVSVVQFGGLAVASLVIGLVFHSVSNGGFLRYPDGVASTQRAHVTDFIPRIELSTARRLIKEGSIFVDARRKRDFDIGHVDGAINVPVDANDVIRRDAMKAVPLDVPVVVYCQSEMCQFADIVAGKIRLDGFSDVSILPGGWMEWSTGVRPRVRRSNENSKSGKWRLNSDGTASPK